MPSRIWLHPRFGNLRQRQISYAATWMQLLLSDDLGWTKRKIDQIHSTISYEMNRHLWKRRKPDTSLMETHEWDRDGKMCLQRLNFRNDEISDEINEPSFITCFYRIEWWIVGDLRLITFIGKIRWFYELENCVVSNSFYRDSEVCFRSRRRSWWG